MLRAAAVAAVTAALLIVAGPAPAHADRPYFQRQCDTGVITWSVKGGRYATAYKAIRWVDRRMDAYRFQQVPVYWDANIAIEMRAPQPRYHPRWLGVTYLWRSGPRIDRSLVKIFVDKDRRGVFLVTVHEIFHALGIPHYERDLSLMNAIGLHRIYPIDVELLQRQNDRCYS